MADDRMMTEAQEAERLKRRLRKKLRQIENLELLDRDLNHEELDKVRKKAEIREQLSALVEKTEEEEADESDMKRQHRDTGAKEQEETPVSDGHVGKRAKREDNVVTPPDDQATLAEPVTHFNEVLAPQAELHYSEEGTSSSNSVDPSGLTEGWEIVNNEDGGEAEADLKESELSNSEGKEWTLREINASLIIKGPNISTSQKQTQNLTNSSNPSTSNTQQNETQKRKQDTRLKISVADKMKCARWKTTELGGHEDFVTDCDIDVQLGLAVTCSRDTTVKVWSLAKESQLHSLRGHTGSVTSVRILPRFNFNCEAKVNGEEGTPTVELDPAAVSGSQDCSLKIWNIETGTLISSTYTYNPISRLEILPLGRENEKTGAVSGTDGGKLEVFQFKDKPLCLLSERIHEEAIGGLATRRVSNHHGGEMVLVASGAKDGLVKVHRLEEGGKKLACLFVSEQVRTNPGVSVHLRPVSCIQISESGSLFIGDHGCNLKLLDWRSNHLSKAGNHQGDIGFTDCLSRGEEQLLIASTFHIDSGDGGINIFQDTESGLKYLATLRPPSSPRLFCLASGGPPGSLSVIAGGLEGAVVLWSQALRGEVAAKVLRLAEGVDSASEGETDLDISEDEGEVLSGGEAFGVHNNKSSGFCNCSLM